MGIRLTRPSDSDLEGVLRAAEDAAPTYQQSDGAEQRRGFRLDRWWRVLGEGEETFLRACQAMESWGMHRGAGLLVHTTGSPTVGLTVAMSAPLPIGYTDASCRVTQVVNDTNRCGFTYVTLPNHPEVGEESFTVVRNDNDDVGIEITAVSLIRHPLGRLVPPVARLLQRRATERYMAAMQDAVVGRPHR